MTVTVPEPTPTTEVATAAPMAGALDQIRAWAEGLQIIGEQMAPLVYTDIVPLHHWPMPPGETLRTFGNPRMRHPKETEEDHERRAAAACASATAVAMRSAELGIPMFVGLAQMWNIRGKLGMDTKLRYALALARGVKAWDVSLDAEAVTVAGIHPATGETVEVTVTMEQARLAGWTSNEAYSKTPVDMLWSRAMGRLLDRVAGHILSGIASIDDLRDERTIVGEVVEAPPAARVTVDQLVTATSGVVHGDGTGTPLPEHTDNATREAPGVAEATLDEAAWRALNAEWQRLGVTGPGMKDRRLRGLSRMLGRDVAKGSDITAAEGDVLLDTLRGTREDNVDRIADLLGETVEEPPPGDDVPPAAAGDEPKGWQ